MSETILVVNAGSSSIKFQLFSVGAGDQLQRRLKGQIEGIGVRPHLVAKGADGKTLIDKTWPPAEAGDVPAGLTKVVEFLRAEIGTLPIAVGHRVVHGHHLEIFAPQQIAVAGIEGDQVDPRHEQQE